MKEESSDIELNGLSDKQIVDLLREVNQEVIKSGWYYLHVVRDKICYNVKQILK